MDIIIDRILMRKYPELASGWHLPLWAKVTDILTPLAGEVVTEEVPVYSVSVQILDKNGDEDLDIPVIEDVLLPVPAGGVQRGFWSKPSVGTVVELAFAYGSPAHPFIRSILPHGLTLPTMAETDQRWQQSEQAYIQVNQENEWEMAGVNSTTTIEEEHTLQVGRNSTVSIEENLSMQIGNLSEIIASRHYAGDDSTNIYELLLELMNSVYELSTVASAHTHNFAWAGLGGASVTSPPLQASNYTQGGADVQQLATTLQGLL